MNGHHQGAGIQLTAAERADLEVRIRAIDRTNLEIDGIKARIAERTGVAIPASATITLDGDRLFVTHATASAPADPPKEPAPVP